MDSPDSEISNHENKKICHHQWINDLIDIDPDRSIYVTYCDLCFECKKDS
tara:strand:+ start:668 stop:817 length:150 start_codon:yes stop_codon:yes gene_type:complete